MERIIITLPFYLWEIARDVDMKEVFWLFWLWFRIRMFILQTTIFETQYGEEILNTEMRARVDGGDAHADVDLPEEDVWCESQSLKDVIGM